MRPTLSAIALVLFATVTTAAPEKPNIIVILADDMGFSDLGCYGGEIATPNLDSLAANGLRFTQFYNCARCCPTRASLLTGLYPHQAGVGHMLLETNKPGYTGGLNATCKTIPEVLKPAGYHNYAVGKWHVTRHAAADGPKANWPTNRGFDRYYGTIHGAGSYFDPSSLVRDTTMISAFADPEYKPATYYYTDAITHHAVKFVGDHAKDHSNDPFFLYVAYTAAHWPMHALPEDIAKYRGKYKSGYEPIRNARFEKAAKLGLIDEKQGMTPGTEDWNKVANKEWEATCMEVYAAMIDRMDQGIGSLIAELKRTGKFDNTLILFIQDNGACAEPQGRTGNAAHPNIARPAKPTLTPLKPTDFITAGSVPAQTRDGYPVRMGPNALPGPADTYVAYGRGWATVSNTPFREYKHWVHEGGISTPLIAHWPTAKLKTGELRHQPGHLIDIMATCAGLANVTLPMGAEGENLMPAFAGMNNPSRLIFWEHEGHRAVRRGDMKLVSKHGKPWELYDMKTDRVEGTDLATKNAKVVETLAEEYERWARRSQVEPWPVAPREKK